MSHIAKKRKLSLLSVDGAWKNLLQKILSPSNFVDEKDEKWSMKGITQNSPSSFWLMVVYYQAWQSLHGQNLCHA